MRRRPLIGLAAAVAVLALASFAGWYWAEGRMQQGFSQWTQAMAARGWTVRAGPPSRHGWPLSVALSFDDFSLSGGLAELPGGVAYTAGRLTLRLDVRQPSVLAVHGEGQQTIRLGTGPALPFTADRLVLSVPLAQGTPPTNAGLDAGGLRFAAPADGLTVGLLEASAGWRRAEPPTTAIRISAEAITLPPAAHPALGPHIASATVEGSIAGTLPPDAQSPAAALAGWRASGGALALTSIALGWGPLGVTGSARLTLDAALQPDATATLRLIGIEDSLTALAAGHVITARAAQTAKAVAGLLAHAPEGGGTPGVEVPVTLHDGTVSLGMIPLATVPKLDWPGGS